MHTVKKINKKTYKRIHFLHSLVRDLLKEIKEENVSLDRS